MPLRAMVFLLSCCVFPALFTARASTIRVPQDLATIQQAIDANPDTVLVDTGWYPEALKVQRGLVLMNQPPQHDYAPDAFPRIRSLTILASTSSTRESIRIRGFKVEGPVRALPNGYPIYERFTFELCHMDSGLYVSGWVGAVNNVDVRGCIILGDANLIGYDVDFTTNSVIGGTVEVYSEGDHYIRGNYIRGPAEWGIVSSSGGATYITGNVIVRVTHGLELRGGGGYRPNVVGNRVEDCLGDGYRTLQQGAYFGHNVARRCGAHGFNLAFRSGAMDVIGNLIDRASADGIRVNADVNGFQAAMIDSNVIVGCGGAGIRPNGLEFVQWNTIVSCEGSGIAARSAWTIDHNIAFGNGRYGLEWSGPSPPPIACNDWFGNREGEVSGASPGSSDVQVDPQFCDLDSDDVRLRPESPLIDLPGCGRVGAGGLGCSPQSTLIAATGTPSPSRTQLGSTVTVPDDTPSIQQAIDSGARVIQVRDGYYPEVLRIDRGLTLRSYPVAGQFESEDYAEVAGMIVSGPTYNVDSRELTVRGIGVRRTVQLPGGNYNGFNRMVFEACRFDSGMTQPLFASSANFLSIRGCTSLQNISLHSMAIDFTLNAVVEGGANVVSEGYHVIRSNYCHGPAPAGIRTSSIGDVYVESNEVTGTVQGIDLVSCSNRTFLSRNVVENVDGDAYVGAECGAVCEDNVARDPCGYGFDFNLFHGLAILRRNVVEHAGQDGIRIVDANPKHLEATIESNVVGRSGGRGVVVIANRGAIARNTIYLNAGSGLDVQGNLAVDGNIAYENGGFGLELSSAETTQPACNDWFRNAAGAVSGVSQGPLDLAIDPMFCDVSLDDVRLRDTSPVLDAAGCGRIGALGVGCVDSPTAALVTGFGATMTAAGVRIRFEIGVTRVDRWIVERSTTGAVWIEVSSVAPLQVGPIEMLDTATEAGSARLYRLVAESGSRRVVVAGPILARADLQSAKLALEVAENPVQGALHLKFVLPAATPIRMSLFDVQGRETAVLARGFREGGTYSVAWDMGHRSAGIYFIRLVTGSGRLTRKVVVAP